MRNTAPRINSIVELLSASAEGIGVLDVLRARYPNQKDWLRAGMEMGEADKQNVPTQFYCDLCREGVLAAEWQVAALLERLPRRLARAKRLRLVTAITTSLSSAGVISFLFINAISEAEITSAVAFIASVGNLVAEYLETTIGGRKSIYDGISEMLRIEGRLKEVKFRLAIAGQAEGETCRELVMTVNELSGRVRWWLIFSRVTTYGPVAQR
jgi:hypothetical protein